MSVLLLLLGVALLYAGGEFLVRGARALATRLGISPLVIGLTVMAFGTSAPELAATLAAALRGVPDLGVGNVLGSNVANIGLILGLAALVRPLPGSEGFVRRELPVVLLTMLALVPLAWNGMLGRLDGLLLLAALAVYLWVLFRADPGRVEEEAGEGDGVPAGASLWPALLAVAAGVGLLVLGAEVLVRGAVTIATALGVPERVIGLSMVAFGTSLPELASSLVAVTRREGAMILGNVAGSNVFNVLAVLGATATLSPLPMSLPDVGPDLVVALAFSAVLVAMMGLQEGLGRKRGAVLLAAYLSYVVYLFV